MRFVTHGSLETEALGTKLGIRMTSGRVIAMFGGMGMGKTAFVRGLARGLGFEGEVSSPTFAIVHEYNGGRLPLYHFDMYRVESWGDLASCGFFDYLDLGGVLAVEWSENIENALPDDGLRVVFRRGAAPEDRTIDLEGLSYEWELD